MRPQIFSQLEYDVLRLYLEKLPLREIAQRLGVTVRSVDGAMQRVKRKIEWNPVTFYQQYVLTHYPEEKAIALGKSLFADSGDFIDRPGGMIVREG